MESGVETCHLDKLRRAREKRPDRCQVVRLVQGCNRHVSLEFRQDGGIDAHRLRVPVSAVHHAMADAAQPKLGKLLAQEIHEVRERAVMAEFLALRPRMLAQQLPVAGPGDEMRRGGEAFV